MQFSLQKVRFLCTVGCLMAGCSQGVPGLSGDGVEVRDGVAVGVLSGREVKLGTVNGQEVKLYNMYGGATLPLSELQSVIGSVSGEFKTGKDVQRAVRTALFEHSLPGIWKLEKAWTNEKPDPVREDDPSYFVFREDGSFRIIKKGRKPDGTWTLSEEGQLVLNMKDGPRMTTEKFFVADQLQMTLKEGSNTLRAEYVRTGLKEEPKAADE